MIPPTPVTGQSEYNRFKAFARAILTVPKSEIPTAEEVTSKLEAEKERSKTK
jgi:hypothetical protein